MWEMAPDQLARYREAVADGRRGPKLDGIVRTVRAAGLEAQGHGVLKTAPKGYAADHPRIELLRFKGLIVWKEWPPGPWLGTRKAKDRVAEVLRAARPMNAWLRTNVGASTAPERGR
jgi:uncharacterized protein (DUF2461 family)